MTKNHTFIASDILTPELMNGLTQDSQIVSASAKQDNSDSIATTQWVRSASGDTALNAATATKLATARKITINLASALSSDFDGSTNINPGVDGILSVSNGGTGHSSVDSSPISGSNRMVTSGGVFTAVQQLKNWASESFMPDIIEGTPLGDKPTLGNETGIWLIHWKGYPGGNLAAGSNSFILVRSNPAITAVSTFVRATTNGMGTNMAYYFDEMIACEYNTGKLYVIRSDANSNDITKTDFFNDNYTISKICEFI